MTFQLPEYIKTCFAVFCGIVFFYMVRANVGITIEPMTWEANRTDNHPSQNYTKIQSGLILSSFYIGYMVFHVFGAIFCTLYGYRKLFLTCVAFCTIFTLLMPVCASAGFPLLILNRILSGVASSPLYPFSHDAIAIWVPVNQMTRVGSATLTGSSVGLILNYLIGGPMSKYPSVYLGWPSFIYFNGALGVVVFILVYFFVYDTPDVHPRLSPEEKKLINEDRHPHPKFHIKDIPWRKILFSPAFIATSIMHGANNFGIYSLTSLGVKYLKKERHYDVQIAGFVMSGVFTLMIISQFIVSSYVNYVIKSNPLRRTRYKKISNSIGAVMTSICLITVPLSPTDVGSVIAMCSSGIFFAFFIPGYFTGMIDMCHDMAAIVMGIANMVGSLSGVACSLLASALLNAYPDDHKKAWVILFGIMVAYINFGAVVWWFWGDCEDQGWVTLDEKRANTTLLHGESQFHEQHV